MRQTQLGPQIAGGQLQQQRFACHRPPRRRLRVVTPSHSQHLPPQQQQQLVPCQIHPSTSLQQHDTPRKQAGIFSCSTSSWPHQHQQQQTRGSSVCARASAASSSAFQGPDGFSGGGQQSSFLSAFWRFLRPHTIRGTILGTSAVVTKVLLANVDAVDWGLLPRALMGLLALLCGNGYIVGINQIYDVDIDAVNKPFLPVAAGDMSPATAWVLVAALAVAGLGIVASNFGPLITKLYGFGLFLGTVYSVPPLRLKRFAVPAFLIIATVRGFLLNFGVFHATRAALGLAFEWNPAILFITCFVTMFATVIAITKDLPDVEGDMANNITTFATRLGVKNVSLLGVGMLLLNYVMAGVFALRYSEAFNVPLMLGAHGLLATILVLRAAKLGAAGYTKDAVNSFYRWIWNLFYAEYFVYVLI